MASKQTQQRADDFLKKANQFFLGSLPTEQPHPKTKDLSFLAQSDLSKAIGLLKEIDLQAIDRILDQSDLLMKLSRTVDQTLSMGGKIFLVGCGATGRLSLNLEYIAKLIRHPRLEQNIISFMAGGDVALVHSLEGFEDFPDYGARHLMELGFSEKDLLIATTEGGETPYVIGAVEQAARISHVPPYFLYCNPDEVLVAQVERSRRVIENNKIEKINLYVGPMALSGSTRMQASTVLMAAVGSALFVPLDNIKNELENWRQSYQALSLDQLPFYIEAESSKYKMRQGVIYKCTDLALPVFTDTTERSPTFNLKPMEVENSDSLSLFYLAINEVSHKAEAWEKLLHRTPRPLNWPEINKEAIPEYLYSFDFSELSIERRQKYFPQNIFNVVRSAHGFSFEFSDKYTEFEFSFSHELFLQLTLKMVLNIHSTLIMGRLNRYEGNLMTWVNPTNGKLIDRTARYVKILLERRGLQVTYEQIISALFEVLESTTNEESCVLRTVESLLKR